MGLFMFFVNQEGLFTPRYQWLINIKFRVEENEKGVRTIAPKDNYPPIIAESAAGIMDAAGATLITL